MVGPLLSSCQSKPYSQQVEHVIEALIGVACNQPGPTVAWPWDICDRNLRVDPQGKWIGLIDQPYWRLADIHGHCGMIWALWALLPLTKTEEQDLRAVLARAMGLDEHQHKRAVAWDCLLQGREIGKRVDSLAKDAAIKKWILKSIL